MPESQSEIILEPHKDKKPIQKKPTVVKQLKRRLDAAREGFEGFKTHDPLLFMQAKDIYEPLLSNKTHKERSVLLKDIAKQVDKKAYGTQKDKEKFIDQLELRIAYTTLIEDYVRSNKQENEKNGSKKEERLKLEDLPRVQNIFEKFDIENNLAKLLFDSWSSFSALQKSIDKNGTDFAKERVSEIIFEQTQMVWDQIQSFSEFGEKYGSNELKSVVDIFGIHNFIRYSPDQLHDQLLRWELNGSPTENTCISSQADYNGALLWVESNYTELFETDRLFFFEAGSATDIARKVVAIGNRERNAERIPDVDNIIIEAHGNPDALILGAHGENLTVADYIDASEKRVKIDGKSNDYKRHLGNRFRLILQACEAGYTVPGMLGEQYLAQRISNEHDTRVDASPYQTSDRLIINPDGSVTFQRYTKGELVPFPANTYYPQQYEQLKVS